MGVTAPECAAVIVTRGDVDLEPILTSLPPFAELAVWDNSVRENVAVYGRYAILPEIEADVVYVQDDDCIVSDIPGLLAEYERDKIVCNMPASRWADYPDSALVGWGAVFNRELPQQAFSRVYLSGPVFHRTCDVVFTTLTPHRKIDLGFTHLPWAEDPKRAMFLQDGHASERDAMLRLARMVRDGG